MEATPGESAEWEGGSRQDVARAQRSMDAPSCAVHPSGTPDAPCSRDSMLPLDIPN
jgi:hypothetical protein